MALQRFHTISRENYKLIFFLYDFQIIDAIIYVAMLKCAESRIYMRQWTG